MNSEIENLQKQLSLAESSAKQMQDAWNTACHDLAARDAQWQIAMELLGSVRCPHHLLHFLKADVDIPQCEWCRKRAALMREGPYKKSKGEMMEPLDIIYIAERVKSCLTSVEYARVRIAVTPEEWDKLKAFVEKDKPLVVNEILIVKV